MVGTNVYRTMFSGLQHSNWLPPNRVIAHYHKVDLISTVLEALAIQDSPRRSRRSSPLGHTKMNDLVQPCNAPIHPSLSPCWIVKIKKLSDIRLSMVTILGICALHLTHPKYTHTEVNTHTLWAHTQSSGEPFMLRRPGSSWGFGAWLKGTLVVVLRVERALDIHSPQLQLLPARDSNSQPFDYESNSLTIRPWLSPAIWRVLYK